MKTISAYWALLVGLLSVAAQVLTYYLRFGGWNTQATFMDYLFFFLAGSLGGSILIYFMNRHAASRARWMVLSMFVLITPLALFMMLGGGLLGPLGILLFPQVPWALFAWLGSLLGRFVSQA